MKSLRVKLMDEARFKKVPVHVVEKDYVLSYILAGIAMEHELTRSLVFKGGTALKKSYFGDYRFSEDLDFSVINAPKGYELEKLMNNAILNSKNLLFPYGAFDLQLKRKAERSPHPNGQDAFIVSVAFPYPNNVCRIKVEITHDEVVMLPPQDRPILHGYDEVIDCKIACYHIEEIVAEKLRALLQTHKKLVTRGWNKPRARDYYDLWCILKNYSSEIDNKRLIEMLDNKCVLRDVSYKSIDDFFTEELVREAENHWVATLGSFMAILPEWNVVLRETRLLILEHVFIQKSETLTLEKLLVDTSKERFELTQEDKEWLEMT
ncbi:MAG: nucleotidyl transferase AbiEii/AbiGii toxin family protein [Gammaproteobacteria bacterium]